MRQGTNRYQESSIPKKKLPEAILKNNAKQTWKIHNLANKNLNFPKDV